MLEKLYKRQEVPREELPLYVLQNAYNEVTEQIRDKQLLQLELYQEIQYRLQQSDRPMQEVVE